MAVDIACLPADVGRISTPRSTTLRRGGTWSQAAAFLALFDTVLKDAGIDVVLSGVRMPRMNSIMGRRVQTCRRELLDRTLIWNQPHLLHALREFQQFYNRPRPHQGIANARPLHPLPAPVADPDLAYPGIPSSAIRVGT